MGVTRFLHQPIGPLPRLLLVAAAVLTLAVYFLPLWNLTMFAPQYPHGLQLDIYDHGLVGGNGGQDIKEINLLNHYIGMRDLVADDFTEFDWMPCALGAIGLLFLRAAVFATVKEVVDAVVVVEDAHVDLAREADDRPVPKRVLDRLESLGEHRTRRHDGS